MRSRLLTLLTTAVLVVTLAGTAMATPGDKHGSCKGFGHAFAAWAQGELGPEAGTPGTVMPVLAQESPGNAADILHAEMTTDLIPGVTPFCDPHPNQ
jgi:hypothetical protein